MEALGMTNACTSVVVPKSSRMMVTAHSAIKPRCTSAVNSDRRARTPGGLVSVCVPTSPIVSDAASPPLFRVRRPVRRKPHDWGHGSLGGLRYGRQLAVPHYNWEGIRAGLYRGVH